MGIDVPGLKHLEYCRKYGSFGKTLTVARQEIHVPPQKISEILNKNSSYSGYCENLLIEHFESTSVDSLDNSNYENCTFVFDLNKEINDESVIGKYDTIIDLGTLEHIYHINNAFYNISKMCKVGGQIIHVLPANNFCGHGFWQFSPEIFFSLYNENNGYSETEVFILDTINFSSIEKLSPPVNGKRILVKNLTPSYVAVRTVLKRKDFNHDQVQQSDYVYLWDKEGNK